MPTFFQKGRTLFQKRCRALQKEIESEPRRTMTLSFRTSLNATQGRRTVETNRIRNFLYNIMYIQDFSLSLSIQSVGILLHL